MRHLTEWFPSFLADGSGIQLPAGPSVMKVGRVTVQARQPDGSLRRGNLWETIAIPEIRAQAANHAFERSFRAAADRFGVLPLPGLNEALAKLSAAGIKICLMSSLSRPAMSLIVERLDWGQRADNIGESRRYDWR